MKEMKIYSGVHCDVYTDITDNFVIDENPIVTISVTSYNSSKYIIETLESIKSQTYNNIILQISDDASTDNTIDICREWIRQNGNRFVKTKIIIPQKNTGVSANSNRAWDECESEWLKTIAGDDILLPNCIEDNIKYVKKHSDAVIIFSKPKIFGQSEDICREFEKERFDYNFFSMPKEERYDKIKYWSCLPASSVFYSVVKLKEKGLKHDERIPMLEDRPKWLNAIKLGIDFDFFDKATVGYRLRDDSLCFSKLLSPRFCESTRLAYFYYVFPELYRDNQEKAIAEIVKWEMTFYSDYHKLKKEREIIKNNCIVKFILTLIHLIKRER